MDHVIVANVFEARGFESFCAIPNYRMLRDYVMREPRCISLEQRASRLDSLSVSRCDKFNVTLR